MDVSVSTATTKMPVAIPGDLKERLREASRVAGRPMQDLIVSALVIMGRRDRLLAISRRIDRQARRKYRGGADPNGLQAAARHDIALEVKGLIHELQSWPDLTLPPEMEKRGSL